jgi:RHS repeat-associated protein
VLDPKANWRYFCYDGDTNLAGQGGQCPSTSTATRSVLVGMRDPLGGTSTFGRRITTGDITNVTRFNGDDARVVLDAFDRPRNIFVTPLGESEVRVEERVYVDVPTPSGTFVEVREFISGAPGAPYVWTRTYSDGLGRARLEEFPRPDGSNTAGRKVSYDFASRILSETYDGLCTDANCASPLSNPVSTQAPVPEIQYSYDALGRLESRSSPDGLAIASYRREVRSSLVYDAVLLKENDGTITQRLLDGDRVAWVDECTNTVSVGESNPGNLSCPAADRTYTEYEPTGEVSTIFDAMATSTAGYSNDRHRLVYLYDTLGRVTEVRDPDGGTSFTTYDFNGNVASAKNARNQITTYTFDALDRLTRVNHPDTAVDSVIEYDPHTRQRSRLAKDGGSQSNVTLMTYEYDALGRESRRVLVGIPELVVDFEYDLLGRVTRIQYPSPDLDVSYQYQGGYLTSVCGGPDATACTSEPDNWFLESVAYDGIGRVTSMEKDVGASVLAKQEFAYHANTYRLSSLGFFDGYDDLVDLDYQYDAQGRVTGVDDDSVPTATPRADASYAYDHRGRLKSWTREGATQHFRYDVLGNLTHRSTGSADPAAANQVYDHTTRPHAITQHLTGGVPDKTYAYDADGNTTQRGSQYYTYSPENWLTCVGPSAGSCSQAQYLYTVDGELYAVKIGADNRVLLGDLYEWDYVTNTATAHIFALGREIAVRTSENATVREAWLPRTWPLPIGPGPLGWGLGALVGAGLLALLARAGAGAALAQRPARVLGAWLVALTFLPPNAWAGGGPPQFGNGGNDWARLWITHDHLGNAILYTDPSGAPVHRRVFEPFGMIAAETPSSPTEPTDRLFTGQRFEDEAGVYNFRARWYDPETGRFLSVDPILQDLGDPQTHNAYGYVRNDPVNLVDPDGRSLKGLLGFALMLVTIASIVTVNYGGALLTSLLTAATSIFTFNAAHEPSGGNAAAIAGALGWAAGAFGSASSVLFHGPRPGGQGGGLVTERNAIIAGALGELAQAVGQEVNQSQVEDEDSVLIDPTAGPFGGGCIDCNVQPPAAPKPADQPVEETLTDVLDYVDEACGRKCDVATVLIPAGTAYRWYRMGREFRLFNMRIAPFGNRMGHPTGRFPHYHRRVPHPTKTGEGATGQGLGRHRPWDTKPTDRSFWDRF